MSRRAVITGIGVRAPGGATTPALWDLLTSGCTATRTISFFDPSPYRSQVAAQVQFEPAGEGLSADEILRMDRATQFAVSCAREAVTDSSLDFESLDPTRAGVSLGSAVAAATSLEQQYLVLSGSGRNWLVDHDGVSPHMFDYLIPSVMPAEIAWTIAAEGPVGMISNGCTSGIDSVGHAWQLIREGSADVMLAGAADAPITPIVVACFDAIKATTPRNDDPEHASRPFDGSRNGFALGEGAAVFVLEEFERARRRGAHIYAEIAGYASRCNAYHMTGLKADGRELAEAISVALDGAQVDPTSVDYINAHGSGTKQNDRHETAAYKRSLGQHAYRTPVSSIKSMIGHSLGAIGSIEIAACALAIEHNVVPPTANLHEADPECDLDYVPLTARECQVDTVLTVGSGFGGFQSAMVLRLAGGDSRVSGKVVVTGIGLLTPIGIGLEPHWQATLEGRRGIGTLSRFDVSGYPARLAGEITGFTPAEHLPAKLLVQTDISTQFALVAADWALQDAKIEPGTYTDYEMGVVTSNASGGFEFTHREFKKLWTQGPASVSVYESFAWFYAVNTGQISIRNALRGPSSALVAEQAGGLDAIGHARRIIRRGTPMVVSGGVDSALDPWGWVSQIAGARVSRATDPARAYLPFDADACGYVPGEGGAILVLEDAAAARSREAQQIYGEIAGYGTTFDPPVGSNRPPGLRRAAEIALDNAGVSPGQVDVVFADGSGVAESDRAEALTISGLFGERAVPVTVPKALTGRLYSGAGPTDIVAALLSMRDSIIPPTLGAAGVPKAYGIDLVTRARLVKVTCALVLARGRGGFNAAVVIRKTD